jgi:crossover junction endodeoxyribonuclease RuvC
MLSLQVMADHPNDGLDDGRHEGPDNEDFDRTAPDEDAGDVSSIETSAAAIPCADAPPDHPIPADTVEAGEEARAISTPAPPVSISLPEPDATRFSRAKTEPGESAPQQDQGRYGLAATARLPTLASGRWLAADTRRRADLPEARGGDADPGTARRHMAQPQGYRPADGRRTVLPRVPPPHEQGRWLRRAGELAMIVVGIDPGLAGAVASLGADGQLRHLHDTPVMAIRVGRQARQDDDPSAMRRRLLPHASAACSNWACATASGRASWPICSCRIPWGLPVAWKRSTGLLGCDKEASRQRAHPLIPTADLARKQDHGGGEAWCIASHGLRHQRPTRRDRATSARGRASRFSSGLS